MTDRDEARRISQLVGGALLLLVGALLALQTLGVLHAGSLGDYWPMLLVWVGVTRLLVPGRGKHVASGALILALGVFFQLDRFGWIGVSLSEVWPLFMVAAGIVMILEGVRSRRSQAPPSSPGAASAGGR